MSSPDPDAQVGDTEAFFLRRNLAEVGDGSEAPPINVMLNQLVREQHSMNSRLANVEKQMEHMNEIVTAISGKQELLEERLASDDNALVDWNSKSGQVDHVTKWAQEQFHRVDVQMTRSDRESRAKLEDIAAQTRAEIDKLLSLFSLTRDEVTQVLSRDMDQDKANLLLGTPAFVALQRDVSGRASTVPGSTPTAFGSGPQDTHGLLGVEVVDAIDHAGVQLYTVKSYGPAAIAGLQADDIVVAINGTPIQNRHEFRAAMQGLQAGAMTDLAVLKAGGPVKPIQVTVFLESRPAAYRFKPVPVNTYRMPRRPRYSANTRSSASRSSSPVSPGAGGRSSSRMSL